MMGRISKSPFCIIALVLVIGALGFQLSTDKNLDQRTVVIVKGLVRAHQEENAKVFAEYRARLASHEKVLWFVGVGLAVLSAGLCCASRVRGEPMSRTVLIMLLVCYVLAQLFIPAIS